MMGSMDAKRISWNRNQKGYQEFLKQSKDYGIHEEPKVNSELQMGGGGIKEF